MSYGEENTIEDEREFIERYVIQRNTTLSDILADRDASWELCNAIIDWQDQRI